MKTKCITILIILFACIAKTNAQKIVIETLSPGQKIDKFTDNSNVITQKFIKENDLRIEILKTLKVTTVKVPNDAGQPMELTKGDATTETDVFIMAKRNSYDKESILLTMVSAAGTLTATIVTAKTDPAAEAAAAAELECKKNLLKALNYSFVTPETKALMTTASAACLPVSCTGCTPTSQNTITYDFLANQTTFPNTRKSMKVGSEVSFRVANVNPFLYDVSISHETITSYQEMNSLLALLSAGGAIKAIGGTMPDLVVSQSTGSKNNGKTCELTSDDKLMKAIQVLAKELSTVYALQQSLNPYYDASCYNILLDKIRTDINASISKNFGDLNLHTIPDMVAYLQANPDVFKDANLATALSDAATKLFQPHFGYVYKARIGNVDRVDFTFNIVPKNKSAALPTVQKDYTIPVYTRGGFKWDVSAGLYYANNLRNEQYAVRSDSDIIARTNGVKDSVINRRGTLYQESDIGRGEFGFSSFLHFYPKISPDINISGIIGAGLSFQTKPQVRYFAGLGLLLGRDTRIGINAGWIWGNVRELSDQYTKDANGKYNPLNTNEIGKDLAYKNHFTVQHFVSFTYNLSVVKKKEEKVQTVTPPAADTTKPAETKTDTKTDTKAKDDAAAKDKKS